MGVLGDLTITPLSICVEESLNLGENEQTPDSCEGPENPSGGLQGCLFILKSLFPVTIHVLKLAVAWVRMVLPESLPGVRRVPLTAAPDRNLKEFGSEVAARNRRSGRALRTLLT